eukprot:CFRG2580T1
MNRMSVTLFKNDGRLDTSTARAFSIDPSWDIIRCRQECFSRLYNTPIQAPFIRLFTELGVEITSHEYIAPLQPIVVSQGEEFVPTLQRVPYERSLVNGDKNNVGNLHSLLTDIYAQNLPPHPRTTETVKRKLDEWETSGREFLMDRKAKYGRLPPSVGGDNANYITRFIESMPDDFSNNDYRVKPSLQDLFDNLKEGIPRIDIAMQMLPNTNSLYMDNQKKQDNVNQTKDTHASNSQYNQKVGNTLNSIGVGLKNDSQDKVYSDARQTMSFSGGTAGMSATQPEIPQGYEYDSPLYQSPFNSEPYNTSQPPAPYPSVTHPSFASADGFVQNRPTLVNMDGRTGRLSQSNIRQPSPVQDQDARSYISGSPLSNTFSSGGVDSGSSLGNLRSPGHPAPPMASFSHANPNLPPKNSASPPSHNTNTVSAPIPPMNSNQKQFTSDSRSQGYRDMQLGVVNSIGGMPSSSVVGGNKIPLPAHGAKSNCLSNSSSKSSPEKNTAMSTPKLDDDMDRTESHKASEQRSRTRLKDSINELATTVPALQNVKNPSKAHIIKKATEFVQNTQNTNKQLREEHKNLKQQLAALHLKHMKSMNTMQLGNIITVEILTKDFTYMFVDHMWEVFLGYSRSEVLGKTFKDISACRNCELMLRRTKEIISTMEQKKVWRGLILGKRKDGRAFCCDTTITPALDDNGEVIQFIINRKKFHMINGVDCQNICRGIMPEPILRTDDDPTQADAKNLIEEAILASENGDAPLDTSSTATSSSAAVK